MDNNDSLVRKQAEYLISKIMASRQFTRGEAVTAAVMLDNKEQHFGRALFTGSVSLAQLYYAEMHDGLDVCLTTDRAAHVIAYVYECTLEDAADLLAQQVQIRAIQLETMQ